MSITIDQQKHFSNIFYIFDCLRRRKLSTLDFKHNSQHVAAAAAASSAQQNGMSVSAIQSQQMVTSTQSIGGNATTGQVATLLPQQPQQIKSSNGGISPTIAGNIASCVSRGGGGQVT